MKLVKEEEKNMFNVKDNDKYRKKYNKTERDKLKSLSGEILSIYLNKY